MRVLAALSGGVDSAVAAALAVEAGHEVTAVHMALSSVQAATRCGSRGCCTVEDASDARLAATMLGIPFYVWDLADTFHETVVTDFLSEYRAGRTPNPCVRCNEFVKFRELLERAEELGFDAVCTGHYARVFHNGDTLPDGSSTDHTQLWRGCCREKDQSYVVAVMGQEALSKVLFPLGNYETKAEVRAEAEKRGLPMSYKPDSYDICFIADGDTRGFLKEQLGVQSGQIVDIDGNVLGQHDGAYQFTVGQRKGLQLTRPAADGRPRYVIRTDMTRNQVIVGAQELLQVNQIQAKDLVLLSGRGDVRLQGTKALNLQYRAHGQVVPALVFADEENKAIRADLLKPTRAVAAGQSLVIYDGEQAIAEATISDASYKKDLIEAEF